MAKLRWAGTSHAFLGRVLCIFRVLHPERLEVVVSKAPQQSSPRLRLHLSIPALVFYLRRRKGKPELVGGFSVVGVASMRRITNNMPMLPEAIERPWQRLHRRRLAVGLGCSESLACLARESVLEAVTPTMLWVNCTCSSSLSARAACSEYWKVFFPYISCCHEKQTK